MKLNVILDSHKGEVLNFLLAISFWNRNEKKLKKINIIYIGSYKNWMLIQEYLEIIKTISNVKVSFFEIESLSISKVKRIKNAILLYCNILILRIKSNLFFVPYDQRSFFYNFLYLLKCKSIALPHTTGLEVYSPGTFNSKLRFEKNIPVLAKIKGCEEYFFSLGFSKIIYGGSYIANDRKDEIFTKLISSQKQKKSIYIFTLSKLSKLYSVSEWISTHISLFEVLRDSNIKDIYIGGHPSQNINDLYDLVLMAKEYLINATISNVDSLKSSKLSDRFISVMTSAAQVPWLMGKYVCGYALIEMRHSVKNFGIDPYPYKALGISDLTNKIDLKNWIISDNNEFNRNSKLFNSKKEINEILQEL